MTASAIKDSFKSFFSDVNEVTNQKPLVTITYAFALTIFSSFIAPFSLILSLSVFAISLPFHIIIIKNFKSVTQNLEEKIKDIFEEDPREKGQILGRIFKNSVYQVYARTIGFFEGIFSNNKDYIV